MEARNLVSRKFQIVESIKTQDSLTFQLEDLESGTIHELKVVETLGLGADNGWYSWTEVHFDGSIIFKT